MTLVSTARDRWFAAGIFPPAHPVRRAGDAAWTTLGAALPG
jgi:hypothetical protein